MESYTIQGHSGDVFLQSYINSSAGNALFRSKQDRV